MLKLNLAPQKIKDDLKLKNISYSINNLILILSIFYIICLGLFYGAAFYLQTNYTQTKNIADGVNQDTESYTNELITINNNLDFIANIQDDHTKWSNLIYSLGLAVNNDLNFNSLRIDKEKNILSIDGHANTRESLLVFKERIETNEYLADIVFPIKTLFEKENIDFSINASIISYEFNEL